MTKGISARLMMVPAMFGILFCCETLMAESSVAVSPGLSVQFGHHAVR